MNLSRPIVLVFPLCVHRVFLIFRAGRASVNCQRLRNELRKIFRTLYFRRAEFLLTEKSSASRLAVSGSAQRDL